MPTTVRWPIAAKLSLLAVTLAIVPLTIVAFIGVNRGLAAVERTALRNIELIAQSTATRLDQIVADAASTVRMVADDDLMIDLCVADRDATKDALDAVTERLHLLVSSNGGFASAFVTNAAGIGLASTSPDNVGQDLTFRDYWQAARAGNPFISGILIGKKSGEPGVYFSRPIRTDDDTIVGVAVLKFRGEAIWAIADEVQTGKSGFASIVDEHGILLAAPNRDNVFKSLGPLSQATIDRIDPQTRWGKPTIESIGLPALMTPLMSPDRQGSTEISVPGDADPFIIGYAPMTALPWTVGIVERRSEFDAPIRRLRMQQLATVIGVGVLATIVALVQARNLAKPIHVLDEAATRVAGGDFDARAHVHSRDEIARLARTFNAMVPKLQQQVKMSAALEVAREVQRNLLPKDPPKVQGLELGGASIPADQTGGDYYDFIDMSELRPGTVGIVIGDVTGHGVGAALLMATGRAVLRSGASPFDDLSRLASTVNVRLTLDSDAGRFMTLFYMVLDAQERRARWISAGHDPAIVYMNASGEFQEFAGDDIPLGIEKDWVFTEESREGIEPGTLIVIGTDGIWEARNPEGDMFGKDRLRDAIRAHADAPCQEIVQRVIAEVKKFMGRGAQQDDITVVAVRMV